MHTLFQAEYIDKGAAMFRLDTMKRLQKSFALHFVMDDPTLLSLPVGSLRERMDGYFFEDLANSPGVRKTIIRRTLMMHL